MNKPGDKDPVTMELPKRDFGTLICLALVVGFMVLVWVLKRLGIL